ncbi:MAG: ferrochelatase [Anaerolineaceae bacterium]|nr:ferrochelatase [Anaerolineaceae bacterium]
MMNPYYAGVFPCFAVDCLETLHEIDIELKESFLKSGGKNFQFIPSLNTEIYHCNAIAKIITDKLMASTFEKNDLISYYN